MSPHDGLVSRICMLVRKAGTQQQAASIAGVTPRQLHNLMKGKRLPSLLSMARLATATGYSLDWLATGQGARMRGSFEGAKRANELLEEELAERDKLIAELQVRAEQLENERSLLREQLATAQDELKARGNEIFRRILVAKDMVGEILALRCELAKAKIDGGRAIAAEAELDASREAIGPGRLEAADGYLHAAIGALIDDLDKRGGYVEHPFDREVHSREIE